MFIGMPTVVASPLFRTDDPEPLEYKHWEAYIASQYANDKGGSSNIVPYFEFEHGLLPDVEVNLLVPFGYNRPRGGPVFYGLGDVQVGMKYRFIQETNNVPMMAVAPAVTLPTGNSGRGLGSGEPQLYLPLWLQKAWGPWETGGGGGYRINPGTYNRNYWFFGTQVQREVAKWLALGAEIFYQTPAVRYDKYKTGYNVGAIIDFTESRHLLCSAGRDIHGKNLFSYFVAYQWTWGPEGKKK
jgi:hypothetical protein